MSIPFSDTVNKNGILQVIEDNCGFNDGDITGNTILLARFTAAVNLALDKAWEVILKSSGVWTLDDANYTDYPFITANLVSGQRDYSFTNDGAGNVILEIYRVMVASPSGVYSEIYPVSQKTTTQHTGNVENTDSFINGQNATGTPTRYDKTGNAIFLDVIPNYNSTNGLKVFIDREASHFVTSDTTKRPGFAGIFHEYLALRASYQYAARKSLENVADLEKQTLAMERAMEEYYVKRDKDNSRRLLPNVDNMK